MYSDSMIIFKMYLFGVLLLFFAIVLNGLAQLIGLPSWYQFLLKPETSLLGYIWLFVGYPLCLGGFLFMIRTIM